MNDLERPGDEPDQDPTTQHDTIQPAEPEPTPAPPTKQPRRRGRTVLILAVATVVIALLAGGGILIKQSIDANRRAEAKAAAVAKAEAAEEKAAAEKAARIEACHDELDDYFDALTEIDARLDIGLTQSDLSDLTGTASVERSRIDEDELEDSCADAKDAADLALLSYATTVEEWNDCIYDYDCDTDKDLDLQSVWLVASDFLDEALTAIDEEGDESGEGGDDT